MKSFVSIPAIMLLGFASFARADIKLARQTPAADQHLKKNEISKKHKPGKVTGFTPASTGSTPSSTDIRIKKVSTAGKDKKKKT